jgi:WD40 repeat protein
MERVHPLRILAGHLSDVDCVQWHVNCNYIATGSSDKTVRLWDVQTGECMRIFTGHRGMVLSLAMSSDGRYMASGDEDGAILMWDLGSGRCVTPLLGHTGCVWTLAFRYSIVLEGECQENSRVTSRTIVFSLDSVMHSSFSTARFHEMSCMEIVQWRRLVAGIWFRR